MKRPTFRPIPPEVFERLKCTKFIFGRGSATDTTHRNSGLQFTGGFRKAPIGPCRSFQSYALASQCGRDSSLVRTAQELQHRVSDWFKNKYKLHLWLWQTLAIWWPLTVADRNLTKFGLILLQIVTSHQYGHISL